MIIKAECNGCGEQRSCKNWRKRHWVKKCHNCGGTYFAVTFPENLEEAEKISDEETDIEGYLYHNTPNIFRTE